MFWNRSEPPPRRPTPTSPTPDDEATEVHTAWQSTLHRHLQAQRPTSAPPAHNAQYPLHNPNQTPPVGPMRTAPTADGFRQAYTTSQVPQRALPHQHNSSIRPNNPIRPNLDETTVFPNTYAQPIPPNFVDPTDIGALIQQEMNNVPYQQQRELEYYGDSTIKNILVVIGAQVHTANQAGVLITENGPTTKRTLIPWHRVHNLKFAPGDPILASLHNYN